MFDLSRGSKLSEESFRRLGLTFENIQNLNPEQQLRLVLDRLRGIENEAERTAVAMQLFGRAGRELGTLLRTSADDMNEMEQRARDLGLVMSNEAAQNAEFLNDRLSELSKVVQVAVHQCRFGGYRITRRLGYGD